MAAHIEYKLISANSPADFQKELSNHTKSGWKPILLTSAANGNQLAISAILELAPKESDKSSATEAS